MNVLDEAKKRPVVSGITLVGAAGAVMLFMGVLPGMELIISIKEAPEVAQAALQKATEAREWIDAYIEQQKQQQQLEQQRYELEQEFNKQLLEMQRQQQHAAPSAPRPPTNGSRIPSRAMQDWVEQDAEGRCWTCWAETKDECWLEDPKTAIDDNRWERCD